MVQILISKGNNDKDHLTCPALIECKTANHFISLVAFFTKCIMFLSYILDNLLIKL